MIGIYILFIKIVEVWYYVRWYV